jgi:hypothetical protein
MNKIKVKLHVRCWNTFLLFNNKTTISGRIFTMQKKIYTLLRKRHKYEPALIIEKSYKEYALLNSSRKRYADDMSRSNKQISRAENERYAGTEPQIAICVKKSAYYCRKERVTQSKRSWLTTLRKKQLLDWDTHKRSLFRKPAESWNSKQN